LNTAEADKKRVKSKKMVLRKKESAKPLQEEEDEAMKVCPRRKPGEDGPCESCSG